MSVLALTHYPAPCTPAAPARGCCTRGAGLHRCSSGAGSGSGSPAQQRCRRSVKVLRWRGGDGDGRGAGGGCWGRGWRGRERQEVEREEGRKGDLGGWLARGALCGHERVERVVAKRSTRGSKHCVIFVSERGKERRGAGEGRPGCFFWGFQKY